MKQRKKALVMLVCTALMLIVSVIVYADTAQEAKNAYANILVENNYISDFSLYDLNNDEIPEMKAGDPYSFYTYYNGEVHVAGGAKAIMEVYPGTGVIKYTRGFKDGSYYEQYCWLINGELITICEENDNISFFDGSGGTVSEEEYQKIVDQYTYGEAPVRPFQEYHPNTPENRELYLAVDMGEETTIHDIGGVWKNDTCTLTIKDGHFKTVFTDENGQVHTVESNAQFAQDGDYFYAIPSDTGNIYYFDYERTGDQLHIWAEARHNGYVEGIIGRSADEIFRLASDYDDVNSGEYREDSNVNPKPDFANTEWNEDDSILPDSSSRRLTPEDIEGLTLQELSYARNEIAARHGRKFNSDELTEYFSSKPWYVPSLEPDDYNARVKSILNDYEIENADWLLSQEKNDAHPEGYILDQEGYDIAKARCLAERNGGTSDNSQGDGTGTDLAHSYDYTDLSVSEQGEIEFLKALSEWIYLNHIMEDKYDESDSEYSWNDLSGWNKYLDDWSFYSSDMNPEEKGMAIALYYFDKEDPRIIYDESDYTYIANVDYMQDIINGLFYDVNAEDIDCFVSTWVKKQFADQYKMYGNVLDGPYLPFYFDTIDGIQISSSQLSISGKIGFEEGVNTSSYEGCGYNSIFIKKEVGGKDYWAFNEIHVTN